MKRALSAILCLACGAITNLTFPSTAEAQVGIRIGGGRGGIGVGSPYYGRPNGGYYGGGYGYGGYGYGRGYYGPGVFGPARGVGVNLGPGYYGSGVRYGTGYDNQPNVVVGTPAPSTYQSFYPPQNGGIAATVPDQTPSDGRGRVTVIVPPNAQVIWNGTSSTLTGDVRRYATLPLAPEGAMQKFEARWTGPDGQTVSQTRDVRATPSANVTVDFTRPETDAKSPANN